MGLLTSLFGKSATESKDEGRAALERAAPLVSDLALAKRIP